MITTRTTFLDTATLLLIHTDRKYIFSLHQGRYLSAPITLNRYVSRDSNRNIIFAYSSDIITITRHGIEFSDLSSSHLGKTRLGPACVCNKFRCNKQFSLNESTVVIWKQCLSGQRKKKI